MSVYPSVTKSVFRSVHPSLKVPPAIVGSSGGGGAFDPDLSGIQSRILDGGTIWTDEISSKYYLKDQSTDNTHLPRQGRCWLFDGTNDYIAIASLTGSETVISKNGTASLTISAGRIDATAGTLWDLVLSNGSRYYCNEESGTTAYDASGNAAHGTLTNITQATFHTASTSVTSNPNNTDGYRLSGSVYIPKRISSSLAADGNALTATGRAAYHGCAETPCVAGNGSTVYVDLGSPLMPATGDYELSFWFFHTSASDERPFGQDSFIFYINAQIVRARIFGAYNIVSGTILSNDTWNKITLNRTGDLHTMTVQTPTASYSYTYTGSGSNSVSANSRLLQGLATSTAGRVSDLRITTGGVTTYFPLQDGPGSSNTNRNLAYVKSDGTGGVISNAIVNGTVSTIWGNRVPGQVKDWCVENGGRIGAAGEYIAGLIGSANAADGNAKTLSAGKHGNPFSRVNLNPATAAEFNGRSVPTAGEVGDLINGTITPDDTGFNRVDTDGDDRFLIYEDTLTGADLTNVENYVS